MAPPFGGYKDFDACVVANSDKRDPKAYCGAVKARTEGGSGGKSDNSEREATIAAHFAEDGGLTTPDGKPATPASFSYRLGVEVFKAGSHTNSAGATRVWTSKDLDHIVDRFKKGEPHFVSVKSGHSSDAYNEKIAEALGVTPYMVNGDGGDRDGQISLGKVVDVYRYNDSLLATLELPTPISGLIDSGSINSVSAEILHNYKGGGYALSGVALLGAERPALAGLESFVEDGASGDRLTGPFVELGAGLGTGAWKEAVGRVATSQGLAPDQVNKAKETADDVMAVGLGLMKDEALRSRHQSALSTAVNRLGDRFARLFSETKQLLSAHDENSPVDGQDGEAVLQGGQITPAEEQWLFPVRDNTTGRGVRVQIGAPNESTAKTALGNFLETLATGVGSTIGPVLASAAAGALLMRFTIGRGTKIGGIVGGIAGFSDSGGGDDPGYLDDPDYYTFSDPADVEDLSLHLAQCFAEDTVAAIIKAVQENSVTPEEGAERLGAFLEANGVNSIQVERATSSLRRRAWRTVAAVLAGVGLFVVGGAVAVRQFEKALPGSTSVVRAAQRAGFAEAPSCPRSLTILARSDPGPVLAHSDPNSSHFIFHSGLFGGGGDTVGVSFLGPDQTDEDEVGWYLSQSYRSANEPFPSRQAVLDWATGEFGPSPATGSDIAYWDIINDSGDSFVIRLGPGQVEFGEPRSHFTRDPENPQWEIPVQVNVIQDNDSFWWYEIVWPEIRADQIRRGKRIVYESAAGGRRDILSRRNSSTRGPFTSADEAKNAAVRDVEMSGESGELRFTVIGAPIINPGASSYSTPWSSVRKMIGGAKGAVKGGAKEGKDAAKEAMRKKKLKKNLTKAEKAEDLRKRGFGIGGSKLSESTLSAAVLARSDRSDHRTRTVSVTETRARAARNRGFRVQRPKVRTKIKIKKRGGAAALAVGGIVGFLAGRKSKKELTDEEKKRKREAAMKGRTRAKAESKT